MEVRVAKDQYQDKFLSSKSKFPALIAGVGTGKTLCLLTKIYTYCEEYPGTTALIVRKEFTDLHDSTMKDFQDYFTCKVGSDKNYKLSNGSMIMFRHADEIAVLKNINVGIAGIEQAEEFEDDQQFQFIRDRLRQNNGSEVRPLCIIANANGHNWIWKLWINQADDVIEIDSRTGQFQFIREEYEAITANTLANESNLPKDFIEDMYRKKTDAPKHYEQYYMNSFEEMEEDDFVFNFSDLMKSRNLDIVPHAGFTYRAMGFDVARYGKDSCAAYGLQQFNSLCWSEFYVEEWDKKDLDATTGRFLHTADANKTDMNIIDEDGIGSGPLDFITKGQQRRDFIGFKNPQYSYEKNKEYANPRTEAAFKLQEYVSKGWIKIKDEQTIQELMTIRYRYMNDGRRILISKEEMRHKYKVKSPNRADALMMAFTLIEGVKGQQQRQYLQPWGPVAGEHKNPQYSQEQDLFKIAGIR